MLITLTLSMSKMNGTLLPEAGAPKLASPTSQLHYSGFLSVSLSPSLSLLNILLPPSRFLLPSHPALSPHITCL